MLKHLGLILAGLVFLVSVVQAATNEVKISKGLLEEIKQELREKIELAEILESIATATPELVVKRAYIHDGVLTIVASMEISDWLGYTVVIDVELPKKFVDLFAFWSANRGLGVGVEFLQGVVDFFRDWASSRRGKDVLVGKPWHRRIHRVVTARCKADF